jgi:hypothetical protein
MQIDSILELKMLCDHGCEPQHQEEAGGDRQEAGVESHHARADHLIEWQKVCEAI